ncbi:hypothetical protein FJTKL_04463 [Diaporthe vaccinii]|uniref:Uncharacterized protein n=1 Tax=Diaporthe vaccinii TaxID=105482 RepID=A0ABR4DTA2_9PEZI
MLSSKKINNTELDQNDMRNRPWDHKYFQAVTDDYDRQNVMNEKMGFTDVVSRKTLAKDVKNTPGMMELNYFGYTEPYLKPHFDEFIDRSYGETRIAFYDSPYIQSMSQPYRGDPSQNLPPPPRISFCATNLITFIVLLHGHS